MVKALILIFILVVKVLSQVAHFQESNFRDLQTSSSQTCEVKTNFASPETIKVGILQSLTGTMAFSETSLVTSYLLAIDEINKAGGVLGRQLQVVLEDGASDWPTFTEKMQKLIDQDKVDVVFCCYTSVSRKSVIPIVEQKNHILIYPVQYEGQECSKNVFYMGATPNQQCNPAVEYMNKLFPNKNFFLLGQTYVFARIANKIMRNQIEQQLNLKSMDYYVPFGSTELDDAFKKILSFLPDGGIIMNCLNGDANVVFFQKYDTYLKKEKYPVLSVSISEFEVDQIGVKYLEGHYAAWNYFMSIKSEKNAAFIKAFQDKYKSNLIITDPMEASYIGVHLWAQAVEEAKTTDPKAVRKTMMNQSYDAAEGKVHSGVNHHLVKYPRIGKIMSNGQFDIIYEGEAIAAEPWSKWIPEQANRTCDWSNDP